MDFLFQDWESQCRKKDIGDTEENKLMSISRLWSDLFYFCLFVTLLWLFFWPIIYFLPWADIFNICIFTSNFLLSILMSFWQPLLTYSCLFALIWVLCFQGVELFWLSFLKIQKWYQNCWFWPYLCIWIGLKYRLDQLRLLI